VKRLQPVNYNGFRHVFLVGLSREGLHAGIRIGLNRYRGRTHRWFFHNLSNVEERLPRIIRNELPCDLFVGEVWSKEVADQLQELGKPVLDIGFGQWNPAWETHRIDWKSVGVRAAESFLEKGYRHAAYYSSSHKPENELIWKGFADTLISRMESLSWGDRARNRITDLLPHRDEKPYEKTSEWLLSLPEPAAMLLDRDSAAENIAPIASFNEILIPEQLSLLGIGNTPLICEGCTPQLSSLELPAETLGYEIGRHIDSLFAGEPVSEFQRFLPTRLVERFSTEITAVEDPIVAQALAIMREEACERTTLRDIVSRLPISPRSFHTHFTNALGRSPKEELFRIRVETARDRLLDTDDTILHISMDCGFSNTDSFVRFFRQYTGMTPTQFRKKNKK